MSFPNGAAIQRPTEDRTLSTLTADTSGALSGPDWLTSFRAAAAQRWASTERPTAELEEWRYSPVAELGTYSFSLPAAAGTERVAGVEGVDRWSALVEIVDGHIVHVEVDPEAAAKGLVVASATELDAEAAALGQVAADGDDGWFGAMTDAFSVSPIVVRVPRGVSIDAPVVVAHHSATANSATFPRLTVHGGESSALQVIESFTSTDDAHLVVPLSEFTVQNAANIGYTQLQNFGGETWSIANQRSSVDSQATFTGAFASFGGRVARTRIDCGLIGRGATGNLRSLFFGTGKQNLDFRTFQRHAARDTTSDLLFKGAVGDQAASVYTGLITVEEEGAGTNAFQTNRNLKLSPDAWAWSVPNLQIENNDVHCSHASTVSPIDIDQLFYLESRGVPTPAAERLLVKGFFDEVVQALPSAEVADRCRGQVAAKLEGLVSR